MKKEAILDTTSASAAAAKAAPTRRRSASSVARSERRERRRAMREAEDLRLEQEARERADRRRDRRAQSREERKGRKEGRRSTGRHLSFATAAVVACVVVAIGLAIIYPAARSHYVTERNNERLAIELAVITERNDTLTQQVASLSTDEGVEDAARSELGWVKHDEEAVVVSGIGTGSSTSPAAVNTQTIAVPTSWYTHFLDAIFFTDTSKPVVVNSLTAGSSGGSAAGQAAES